MACRGERHRHRPLSLGEKVFEPVAVLVALDKAQELDVVAPEHDAVIGGALADMAAARGHGKTEPRPAKPGALQVTDADDDVVDPRDAVIHRPHSLLFA